ncbi:MAG: DPP IV N-terminal domain-containing protein, partial [Wenzhouxiangella sp.]
THAPPADTLLGPGADTSLSALQERARQREHGGVGSLAWHPDGSAVYYVLEGELRRVDANGGTSTVVGPGGSQLAVSPDGRYLSMLRGGDLWLLDIASHDLLRATELGLSGIGTVAIGAYVRPDAYIGRYRWSPDSRSIAFEFIDQREVRRVPFPSYLHDEPLLHEVRRPYPGDTDLMRKLGILDLAALDLANARLEWIGLEAVNRRLILEFEWAPDSERLLVMQGADVAEERWIHIANLTEGSLDTVWHDQRPNRVYPIFRARWSGDGEHILFIGDHEAFYRLYALDPAGGTPVRLTGDFDIAGDRSAAWMEIEANGDILYVSSEHSPYERHIYRLFVDDGRTERLSHMPGVHQPALSPDGRHLALMTSNDTTPTELYWLDIGADGTEKERRITHSPLAEFDQYDWIEPRYVSFPSRIDDFTIHARIIEPPNFDPERRYPVIFGSIYSNTVLNYWNPDRPTSLLQQQMALAGDYITV